MLGWQNEWWQFKLGVLNQMTFCRTWRSSVLSGKDRTRRRSCQHRVKDLMSSYFQNKMWKCLREGEILVGWWPAILCWVRKRGILKVHSSMQDITTRKCKGQYFRPAPANWFFFFFYEIATGLFLYWNCTFFLGNLIATVSSQVVALFDYIKNIPFLWFHIDRKARKSVEIWDIENSFGYLTSLFETLAMFKKNVDHCNNKYN